MNDMKMIMESFNRFLDEERVLLESDKDLMGFVKAVKDNLEDYQDKNRGKQDLDEVVITSGLIFTIMTTGAALTALVELVAGKLAEYVAETRTKFDDSITEKWTEEVWLENIASFFGELKRGFGTAFLHTIMKYLGKFFGVFGSEKSKKNLDKFADVVIIVLGLAALFNAGVIKKITSVFQGKMAIVEMLKSVFDSIFGVIGKSGAQWLSDLFAAFGSGGDVYDTIKAGFKAGKTFMYGS